MKRVKYDWHKGCKYGPKDAQTVGRELTALKKEHPRGVTADIILDSARFKNAPLHRYFTWEDKQASEKYRLQEAHYLLSNLKVVYVNEQTGKEYDVRAFWSVKQAEGDVDEDEPSRTFLPVIEVVSNEDLRKAAIARFLAEIASLRDRYAVFQELSGIFEAIDRGIEQLRLQPGQRAKTKAA